ncbi:MAG: helix-turn-helix domain-containing protein [Bacillota bacterium]
MSNLGELFRQIRLSKNWSIRQAAKKMGISYSYLSILEKGVDPRTGKDSNPKPETLKIISKAYDYPYEELMKAAGYLSDDAISHRKFDLALFVSNINLLMGKKTIEEFSQDIHSKTGYQIKPSQIRSYLNGDIEPFPGTLNILCKYAQVTMDFWYMFNTPETLEHERNKYKENLKASSEPYSKEYIFFSNLPDDVKKFVAAEENIPYIKVAMDAQRKKINPNTLKLLVETIVSEMGNIK